jgi:isovaleryl-CoA dehydrogenase
MIESRHEIQHHFKEWCQKNQPLIEDIKKTNDILPRHWQQLGQDGLLGCMIDESYGGSGLELAHFTDMLTEIAYHSPSLALSILAHSQLCADLIQLWGDDAQKNKYLPKLALGQMIGSTGISEDNAGSDALSMKTHLDDDHCLNGHKMWITNGPIADISIIYARHHNEIKAMIVDLTPEMKSQPLEKLGMKSSPTGRLSFTKHPISPKQILIQTGHRILKTALDKERIALSAIPIGIMKRALDEMISHCDIRKQFGSKLAGKQLIQDKIATAHTLLASSKALMESTLSQTSNTKLDAATLYLHTSQSVLEATRLAMDTFGAMGYMNDCKATELAQDARLFQVGGGSIEIRKLLIGHLLTKEKAY